MTTRREALGLAALLATALGGCGDSTASTDPATERSTRGSASAVSRPPGSALSTASAPPTAAAAATSTPSTAARSPTGPAFRPKTGPTAATGVRIDEVLDPAAFRRLHRSLSGPAGVAIALATEGADRPVVEAGDWQVGPAWSTAKVPLVMAALARSESRVDDDLANRAIRQSDNAAALELWRSLGTPTQAAHRMEAELSAGHDSTTVERRTLRAGFSPFGQTRWRLADQAVFAAALPCLPHAHFVLGRMQHISSAQSWGLGGLGPIAYKGGWGPGATGSDYVVRQLAAFGTTDGRRWGVAIGVDAGRGFVAGTRDLDAITRWLRGRFAASKLTIVPPECAR